MQQGETGKVGHLAQRGKTVLFSSHILGDVERVADRIGILVDGVLRVDCPTDHFKQSVCRLVLTFEGEPKPFPKTSGVISDVAHGHRRELVVVNYSQEHRKLRPQRMPYALALLHLVL